MRGGEGVNVKGRDAIIIDDIISTGNTIVEAANLVRKAGRAQDLRRMHPPGTQSQCAPADV